MAHFPNDVGARSPRLCLQTGFALHILLDLSFPITQEKDYSSGFLPAPRFPSLCLCETPTPCQEATEKPWVTCQETQTCLLPHCSLPSEEWPVVPFFPQYLCLHSQPHCSIPVFTAIQSVKLICYSHKGSRESKVGLEKESSLELGSEI